MSYLAGHHAVSRRSSLLNDRMATQRRKGMNFTALEYMESLSYQSQFCACVKREISHLSWAGRSSKPPRTLETRLNIQLFHKSFFEQIIPACLKACNWVWNTAAIHVLTKFSVVYSHHTCVQNELASELSTTALIGRITATCVYSVDYVRLMMIFYVQTCSKLI